MLEGFCPVSVADTGAGLAVGGGFSLTRRHAVIIMISNAT